MKPPVTSFQLGHVVLACVLCACAESPHDIRIDEQWCVTAVTLTPQNATIAVGDSAVFAAAIDPAKVGCNHSSDHSLAWSLSDSSKLALRVNVDSTVVVRALKPGSSILIVRMRAFQAVAAASEITVSGT